VNLRRDGRDAWCARWDGAAAEVMVLSRLRV
jgi:hypothetical protein